jgi:hypothetical protein
VASLLDKIIEQYLSSRDFNGLYVDNDSDLDRSEAVRLVQEGLVQVVDETDWMNPHIRPWPSRRSVSEQTESINSLGDENYGLCVYPTAKAMQGITFGERYTGEPYREAMARGRGTLEVAFFKFEVLESYRNDPRFEFRFNDFGVDISVRDEIYLDEDEPDEDKMSIGHVGFAYDLSQYDPDQPDSTIVRRVCAFYCDLTDMTPLHQQRWRTYEIPSTSALKPHPIWWGQQMGRWPDGIGAFQRFFYELRGLNQLHERAFGEPLLSHTERPQDFGWLLRPSEREYSSFVHELDKLLSDNIRHKALDGLDADRRNDADELLGTLSRLEEVLTRNKVDEAVKETIMNTLRGIRKARQKPAHALAENFTDSTFIHRQANLLMEATAAVELLRRIWQNHPANTDWEEPEILKPDTHKYWL